jgi:hypothetical protein
MDSRPSILGIGFLSQQLWVQVVLSSYAPVQLIAKALFNFNGNQIKINM